MTLTLIPTPPAVDTDELRRAASRLSAASQRYESAARRLATRLNGLPTQWHGAAAAAAVGDLHELQARALAAADVHAEAAGVLLLCAARVEDAQHTWRLAAAMDDGDVGSRYAAQAQAAVHEAIAQAASAMSELASRAPAADADGLTMREQVAGFGRGTVEAIWGSVVTVAELSLPRMLADRDGWAEDVRGMRDGAAYAVGHPREAGKAAVGWDLLAGGRYGEWAGGFAPDLLSGAISGGALPVGRRAAEVADDLDDLADDVDDLQRVHRRDSNAGGPVTRQQDADLPADYVDVIGDLTPERRRHILDGDETGGGHRHGTGNAGKTEFPAYWPDDEIIRRVMETARTPRAGFWSDRHKTFNVTKEFDGVVVVVGVTREGHVKTAFPQPGGQGVVRNPR